MSRWFEPCRQHHIGGGRAYSNNRLGSDESSSYHGAENGSQEYVFSQGWVADDATPGEGLVGGRGGGDWLARFQCRR